MKLRDDTLIIILLFSWFGDGNTSLEHSKYSVTKASPNTDLKAEAIARCCGMLQWFSIDKING